MDASVANNPNDLISRNIVHAMSTIKDSSEFDDFSVEVEGKIFSCHSFVLLSCSEFFRGMLRSNMKEKKDRTVRLSNISATTFQLILDTLYTGDNLVTTDNLIDMWHAVHQLQITFLMEFCEDFAVSHLTKDNLELYKRHVDYLHSRRARLGIMSFIMRYFPEMRNTDAFLNLDKDDVKQLVESDDLNVDGEDPVLQSVYAWVLHGDTSLAARKNEAGDQMDIWQDVQDDGAVASTSANARQTSPVSHENDRRAYLAELLQCTRYCFASEWCIFKLYQHPLTLTDPRVKDILFKANAFRLNNYCRGFWPTEAIYRDCWRHDHVAVYCTTVAGKFVHLSLKKNTVVNVMDCPVLNAIKLVVFCDRLYACTYTRGNLEIFTLEKRLWIRVGAFQLGTWDRCLFMLAHGHRIFVISRKKMRRFDPFAMRIKFQQSPYDIASPQHAISFHNKLLIFAAVDNGTGVVETAVYAWDQVTEIWSRLLNLQFTPANMISFEDGVYTYILDPSGYFWKLTDADTVQFTYIGKLWDLNIKLTGGLLFRKSLYLFVENLASAEGLNFKNELGKDIFNDVKFQNTNVVVSNVVHLVKNMTLTFIW